MEPWCWPPAQDNTEPAAKDHSCLHPIQGCMLQAGPARPHRGCPGAVKSKPLSSQVPTQRPTQASLSASNNWGSLPSWNTFVFTAGLALSQESC